MRCRVIFDGLFCDHSLVLAPPAAARLPSRSSCCLTRLDCPPRLIVSGSGELGVGVIVARRARIVLGVAAAAACFGWRR